MRIIKNLLYAFVATIILASCGGDTITPVSEEIQGPLGQYFEVVLKKYRVHDDEVYIEFRRIKDGFPSPWKEGTDIGDSYGCIELQFNVEFLDKDGNVISQDETDIDYDVDELESVARLGVKKSSTIQFDCFDCEEGVKKFKVSSSFKVHGTPGDYPEGSDRLLSREELKGYSAYELKVFRNEIYARHGFIFHSADMIDHFSREPWYKGTNASSTDVYYSFSDIEKKNVELLKAAEAVAPKYSTRTSGDMNYSSTGTRDWDNLLAAYERFVNKFSSFADKAANGDKQAIAEYPSLMAEMARLSETLENIDDSGANASGAQLNRYYELTKKLTAAQMKFTKVANAQLNAIQDLDLDDLLDDFDD